MTESSHSSHAILLDFHKGPTLQQLFGFFFINADINLKKKIKMQKTGNVPLCLQPPKKTFQISVKADTVLPKRSPERAEQTPAWV